ncbi:glycosyltransferase family 2 protein [Methylobacterium longum]|uniref:Glycosyltransferase family 2 protein n=1 Tax=Methylobacterium longum TaxID=767694 RepID=A0ABT8AUT5_9HYPH|nr:glycosyltransferase family 2 protein [Methylobacterium longum]MDN3573603.1 glycosyltransferase family 2 protein [Methylobacterium longum]GJE13292.1 hypothetical protein FOHLNKBM_4355 [Methylobacterium longum]
MKKSPLAVVTMAYNEAVLLPLWLRHYDRQIGSENCYIIDHGSDDGSTSNIKANLIRLPRAPLNEWARSNTVRDFCSSLFISFEYVLYVDADEIVFPDPDIAATLADFMISREHPPVVDLFGTDIRHVEGEPDIDLSKPISQQRKYSRPISSLCKPTLISERVDWHIGFHCLIRDHRPSFNGLYLFHLAHFDNNIMYDRQKKRNASAPVGVPNSHHEIDPQDFVAFMRQEGANLTKRSVQMRNGEIHFEATKRNFADAIERKDWSQAPDLWRLPERFIGLF